MALKFAFTAYSCILSQTKYTHDIFNRASIIDEMAVATPSEYSAKLSTDNGKLSYDPTQHREVVGSLLNLVVTHLDIQFSVLIISPFKSRPHTTH